MRLTELLDAARKKGLTTPPLFLSVLLCQRISAALAASPAVADGALEVSFDFDGAARVERSGGAARDVADLALVLDALLGEQLDAELTRLINEARRAGTDVDSAALERRLGHWLVKQRQLFPSRDLVAEWLAWVAPAEAPRPVDPAVAAWLDAACSAPLEPAPPIRPSPAPTPRRWPAVVAVAGAIVALGLALLAPHDDGEPLPTGPRPLTALVPARLAPPPPSPVTLAAPAEPALPRHLTAPTTASLSGAVHGLALEQAGFVVMAPTPERWALRIRARDPKRPPPYAALFTASLDAQGHVTDDVSVVGTTWKALDARQTPGVRVFAVQPDQRPDEGTFGLDVGTPARSGFTARPDASSAEVFTDAMTQQEGRRLVVDLDPLRRYRVTLAAPSRARVVASATAARGAARTAGRERLHEGTPLDQTLLQPGAPLEVRGVTRLSFVVLTTTARPDEQATVSILEAEPAQKP